MIVPVDNANETSVLAFQSTDGGASWSSTVTVATIKSHTEGGGLRSGPLPSAEIDGSGTVYVAWSDCRFRKRCGENDIVYSTSTNGTTWSTPTRVPIDATTSSVDHFLPGLAIDKATSGTTAHIALSYYYYPTSSCNASTCQLDVGFVKSSDAGATWTTATQLAGPMSLSWLPSTSQGPMVGDYMSTSWSNSLARPAIEVALAPSGGVFNQATYVPSAGLLDSATTVATTSADRVPLPGVASDHVPPTAPVKSH